MFKKINVAYTMSRTARITNLKNVYALESYIQYCTRDNKRSTKQWQKKKTRIISISRCNK